MNNTLYRGIVVPPREAKDGETPTAFYATQENNGCAIWRESFEDGTVIVKHELYLDANKAVEETVQMVLKERAALKATEDK